MLALSWASYSYGSLSEVEPNSTVTGTTLFCAAFGSNGITCIEQYVVETGIKGAYPAANLNPSLATPLSPTDQTTGQLHDTRDYDWYKLPANQSGTSVIPVYFGCDKKLGYYVESIEPITIDPAKDLSWQIELYYENPQTPGVIEKQSSYVVYPEACIQGTAETKGPARFQMDTQRSGNYYLRIWGRLIESNAEFEDKVSIGGQDVTRKTFYDKIVVPTADYTVRAYSGRTNGAAEPNDGMQEAYPLISGTTATGQLSSMYDQDWYYIDNVPAQNTSGQVPFYFNCKNQTGTFFILSSYDEKGVLQNSYQVQSSQCSGAGGFLFSMPTPAQGRYYFVVASPPSGEAISFTQADYTVLAISNNSGVSGSSSRLPGEQEPNETPVNAYPLTNTQALVAQLNSLTDLDYYYVDNDTSVNPSGLTPIYFRCAADNGVYTLSFFNTQGFLQNAYTVSSAECATTTGFQAQMNTPATARYYVLLSGPPGNDSGSYSNANYTIGIDAGFTSASLRNVRITNKTAANKDSFSVNMGACGGKGGVKLNGSKLNLVQNDTTSTQVKVEIGDWSCTSGTKPLTVTSSSAKQKTYVYPAPAPAIEPTPEPPKTTQISGTN